MCLRSSGSLIQYSFHLRRHNNNNNNNIFYSSCKNNINVSLSLLCRRFCHITSTPVSVLSATTLSQPLQQEPKENINNKNNIINNNTNNNNNKVMRITETIPQIKKSHHNHHHKHSTNSMNINNSVGHTLQSYSISPVLEEYHCLWQWRAIQWGNKYYAVPFLLHCAAGISMRRPFIHNSTIQCIRGGGNRNNNININNNNNNNSNNNRANAASMLILVPTPIGALSSTVAAPISIIKENKGKINYEKGNEEEKIKRNYEFITNWVEELFQLLEKGAVEGQTRDGFNGSTEIMQFMNSYNVNTNINTNNNNNNTFNNIINGTLPHHPHNNNNNNNNHNSHLPQTPHWNIPLTYHNIISCGLAEVIIAIDRYAAMLVRRDISLAKACWAVLADSKSDVQPYLRSSALAIEKELIAATEAHHKVNLILGKLDVTVRRPLVRMAEYPTLVGW